MRAVAIGLVALQVAALAGVAADPYGERFERIRRLQQSNRWAESDSLAAALVTEAERAQPPDTLAWARALSHRGLAVWGLKLYRDSTGVRQLARSLDLQSRLARPDTLLLAMTLNTLGRITSETGNPDSGVALLQRARHLREARLGAGDTLVADSWFVIAQSEERRGRWNAALDALERAQSIRLASQGPHSLEMGLIAVEQGRVLTVLERFDEARAAFQRSLDVFRRTLGPNAYERFHSYSGLALLQSRLGNSAGAVENSERALAVVLGLFPDLDPRVLQARGNVGLRLLELGDYTGARRQFELVTPGFEKRYGAGIDYTERSRLALGIACVLEGDTASAMRQLDQGRRFLDPPNATTRISLAQNLRWTAEVLVKRGQLPEARAATERALALLAQGASSGADDEGPVLNLLATIQARQGDRPGMEASRARFTALLAEPGVERARSRPPLLQGRALVSLRLGDREGAWADALEGERLVRERLQLSVRALDDRHALFLSGRLDEALEQVVEFARGGSAEQIRTAWDRVVRWRGLVSDVLAERRLPASTDSVARTAHERWVSAQREYAQLAVAGVAGSRDSAARARFERAQARAEEAERDYRRQGGAAAASGDVTLARVLDTRSPGDALVAFLGIVSGTDTARVVAFVAPAGDTSVRLVDIGSSRALGDAIAAWRDALSRSPRMPGGVDEAACRARGQAVRDRVWAPLEPLVGDARQVAIVPDGPVADLIWEALPAQGKRYMADGNRQLRVLDAERELLTATTPSRGGGLLAVGGPDFDSAPPAPDPQAEPITPLLRSAVGDCLAPAHLGALPGARAEANDVAGVFASRGGARLLVGDQATEAAFKRDAPSHAVVHVATHGVVVGDTCTPAAPGARGVGGVAEVTAASPKPGAKAPPRALRPEATAWLGHRVWLAFAGANRAFEGARDENEGMLTAEEVVTLDLRGVDWVVLSACQSGLGERWAREGSAGMARAFRLAGARSVIASQWSVEDESAREWMRALYAGWSRGAPAAAAAQQASRSVLDARRREGRSTHPFYWGAFVANGQ